MASGTPDFWLRGLRIDLIDLVNTVKLIQKITQISDIDTVKLITLIEKVNSVSIQQELIGNGGFETGDLSPWLASPGAGSVSITRENVKKGLYACKIVSGTPAYPAFIYQYVSQVRVQPGDVVSCWWHSEAGSVFRLYAFYTDLTEGYVEDVMPSPAAWRKITLSPTVGKRISYIYAVPYTFGGITYYVDEFESYFKPRVIQDSLDRIITDVTKVAGVTKYLPPTALAAGGSATIWTPATGKAIRLKRLQVTVNAETRIDLKWGTETFKSYFLPANGTVEVNLIGCNEQPAADTPLTLYSSAAATVSASVSGDEV